MTSNGEQLLPFFSPIPPPPQRSSHVLFLFLKPSYCRGDIGHLWNQRRGARSVQDHRRHGRRRGRLPTHMVRSVFPRCPKDCDQVEEVLLKHLYLQLHSRSDNYDSDAWRKATVRKIPVLPSFPLFLSSLISRVQQAWFPSCVYQLEFASRYLLRLAQAAVYVSPSSPLGNFYTAQLDFLSLHPFMATLFRTHPDEARSLLHGEIEFFAGLELAVDKNLSVGRDRF